MPLGARALLPRRVVGVLAGCLALTATAAFSTTLPAHAGGLKPGATGLHDGMMPASSPDAQAVTSSASGGATVATAAAQTGVDVSSHQHPSGAPINWGQVAASGQSFALVKATELYTDTSGPVLYTNPSLSSDLNGAHAAGLVVGSYAFAHPENSATTQADAFATAIGTLPSGSLPPVLDLEVSGGLGVSQLVAWTHTFLDRLQADTNVVPMIYTSPNFWNTYLGGSIDFARYPLWEAHYTTAASPQVFGGWSTYDLWQFTDNATVAGISTIVDENRSHGQDLTTLAQHPFASSLPAGSTLSLGGQLRSPDQQYSLVMQADGNLVEYGNGRALWWTSTSSPGAALVVQTDGNVVIYSTAGAALWNTGTWWAGPGGALALLDDGSVAMTASSGSTAWSNRAPGSDTMTAGAWLLPGQYLHDASGAHVLTMQGDGNLVLYRRGVARWSSGTWGRPGARAVLQGDGNVVVYDLNGVARWSSRTNGSGASDRLVMQTDGNLVLYGPTRALWATWTMD